MYSTTFEHMQKLYQILVGPTHVLFTTQTYHSFFKQQRHNLIFHKTKINTIIIYTCGTKQWYWRILDNEYNSNNINIMMIRCCFESFGVPLPKQSYTQRQRQTLTNITPSSSSSSRHCY